MPVINQAQANSWLSWFKQFFAERTAMLTDPISIAIVLAGMASLLTALSKLIDAIRRYKFPPKSGTKR